MKKIYIVAQIFLKGHWIKIAISLGILSYVITFCFIAYLKYRSFSFHDIDLAVINQTFWNAIHGKISGYSPGEATIFNGGHVWLIIFVLAPIYALFPSPVTLLFLQSLALALGTWPIYLLAKQLIKPSFGLLFAFCYLIYPALNYVNLYEFHFIALSTPLLLFMFLFYLKKKWCLFILFVVLSLFCRQDVAIPVFAFGVFGMIQAYRNLKESRVGKFKWGLVALMSALIWFIFCIKFLQPHFSRAILQQTESVKGGITFYSWLGNSISEIIKTIIFHPGKVLQGVLIKPKILYLYHLFVPVAFLPIFSPSALLMTLISLAEGLLSQRFSHYSIRYQYSSIIIPFVFISAIYGLRNLFKWKIFAGKEKLVLMVVLLFSLVSAKTLGPLFNLPEGIKQWRVTEEDQIRQKFVEKIPPRAPMIATFEFAPKLSMRPRLFYFYHVYSVSRYSDFRINITEAQKVCQYALLDFNDSLTFYDFYTPGGDRDVYKFLHAGNWQLMDAVNSIALFRKGEKADLGLVSKADPEEVQKPLNIYPIPQLKIMGYALEQTTVLGNPVLSLGVYFSCLTGIRDDLLLTARFTSQREPAFSFQQPFFASYRIYPTSRWRPGEKLKQQCNVLIPDEAPAGSYDLTVALMTPRGRGYEGKVIFQKRNAITLKRVAFCEGG